MPSRIPMHVAINQYFTSNPMEVDSILCLVHSYHNANRCSSLAYHNLQLIAQSAIITHADSSKFVEVKLPRCRESDSITKDLLTTRNACHFY